MGWEETLHVLMIAPILLKEYVMDLMEPVYACLDLEETTVEVIMIFFKVKTKEASKRQ
jgi:hypothetical protein